MLYLDFLSVDKMSEDVKAIDNAIKNILLTPIGTLPGKPLFGSRLYQILFEPMDGITEELVKRVIQEAIVKWEDRIIITNVDVQAIPEYNRYVLKIYYYYKDEKLNYTSQISLDLTQQVG